MHKMQKSRHEQFGLAAVIALLISAGTIGSSPTWAATARKAYTAPAPAQMTEAAAKKHITDENYTDVTNLHKLKDGWSANAKSLGTPVLLIINNMGNIDQQ
jgi:hypothetical protein